VDCATKWIFIREYQYHVLVQCSRFGNKNTIPSVLTRTTPVYYVLQSESKKYDFVRLGKVLIINNKKINTGGPIPTVSRFHKTFRQRVCSYFYILVIGLVGRYVTRFRRAVCSVCSACRTACVLLVTTR